MKNKLFRIIPLLFTILGLVFWLLYKLEVAAFSWFTFAYVCVFALVPAGISLLVSGAMTKNDAVMQKTRFICGTLLALLGAFALVGALAKWHILVPILLLVFGIAVLFVTAFSSKDKWDKGDNEQPGYKSYRERKAEEEAKAKEAESKEE